VCVCEKVHLISEFETKFRFRETYHTMSLWCIRSVTDKRPFDLPCESEMGLDD